MKVDALRVLINHKFTLCPDRRSGENIGAVWNSMYGVLLWNPKTRKSIPVLANTADNLTYTLDLPNELSVYDLNSKPMKGQIIPMFQPRAREPGSDMHNEFTAILERDGPWYIAYCAEVPGANGQGKSRDECLANTCSAIELILHFEAQPNGFQS